MVNPKLFMRLPPAARLPVTIFPLSFSPVKYGTPGWSQWVAAPLLRQHCREMEQAVPHCVCSAPRKANLFLDCQSHSAERTFLHGGVFLFPHRLCWWSPKPGCGVSAAVLIMEPREADKQEAGWFCEWSWACDNKDKPCSQQSLGEHHAFSSTLTKASHQEPAESAKAVSCHPLQSPSDSQDPILLCQQPWNPLGQQHWATNKPSTKGYCSKDGQDPPAWPSPLKLPASTPSTHTSSLLTCRNLPAESRPPHVQTAKCNEHRADPTGAAGIIPALAGDTGWALKEAVKGNGGLSISGSLQTEEWERFFSQKWVSELSVEVNG